MPSIWQGYLKMPTPTVFSTSHYPEIYWIVSWSDSGAPPNTLLSPAAYRSRVRTEPTSATVPQYTTALWVRLESMFEEMTSCCTRVWPMFHPIFIRLLSAFISNPRRLAIVVSFWSRLCVLNQYLLGVYSWEGPQDEERHHYSDIIPGWGNESKIYRLVSGCPCHLRAPVNAAAIHLMCW